MPPDFRWIQFCWWMPPVQAWQGHRTARLGTIPGRELVRNPGRIGRAGEGGTGGRSHG